MLKRNTRNRRWPAGFAVALAFALGACGNTTGLNKISPDEFSVVSKAPLVVPPDFNLRPPRPGSVRPQDLSPQQQAINALFPNRISVPEQASKGELALLKAAGAVNLDPNVRQKLRAEATIVANKGVFTRELLFWNGANSSDNSVAGTQISQPTIERVESKPLTNLE